MHLPSSLARTRTFGPPRRWCTCLWLVLAVSSSSLTAQTQTNRYNLWANGPATARINIVVFPEGYTTNALATYFVSDATDAVARLLAVPPYAEYSNYFNAIAVSVASAQSGSSHPSSGVFKNTYFNSGYDTNGYLVTIPATNYPNTLGTGRMGILLTNWVPEYNTNRDFVILLINGESLGGSGGALTISALSAELVEEATLAHETGHTLGRLDDEYESSQYADLTAVAGEAPNATTNTIRSNIVWNTWIDAGTPVPTPTNSIYTNVIGLFEGANYASSNWYRPKLDCLMRNLLDPTGLAPNSLCEVCSEALVKSIYRRVRPIQKFAPTNLTLNVTSTPALAFNVMPMQPATHALAIQWFSDGNVVYGETNTTFQWSPAQLTNGNHSVSVVVNDPTPQVRSDPAGLLRQTNTWTVAVSLTQLALTNALYLPGGQFRLTIAGTAAHGFVLQASTNLLSWVPLTTNSLSGGRFDYTNSGLSGVVFRFYRAYGLP